MAEGFIGNADAFDDMWTYDPAANTWAELKSASSPRGYYKTRPAGKADSQLMAYDEEHNVHVIALQEWCGDDAVWVTNGLGGTVSRIGLGASPIQVGRTQPGLMDRLVGGVPHPV